jgi:putative Holliday junction resolvase
MKRLLAIDLGRARSGLAISDELGLLAHPLETLESGKTNEIMQRIGALVREKNIERVVVGLPRNMDGSLGAAAKAALAFAEKLRAQLSCPVVTWDERLTTVAANRILHEAGRATRSIRGCIDQVAAQMILQGYLDQLQMRAEEKSLQQEHTAE